MKPAAQLVLSFLSFFFLKGTSSRCFLRWAFPTKSHPNCLTVGQTACFCSFLAQRDGQRTLSLLSIFPHWSLMSLNGKKKIIFFGPWTTWGAGEATVPLPPQSQCWTMGQQHLTLWPPPLAMGTTRTNKGPHGEKRQDALCVLSSGRSRTWPRLNGGAWTLPATKSYVASLVTC